LPLPSFYKARDSPGGGNGQPPKYSVTEAFNEETYVLVANGWNVSAFNGGAVTEEEDERTVAAKRLRFPILKAALNLVLGILVILQSSPLVKM
jgi:hypothetical protein